MKRNRIRIIVVLMLFSSLRIAALEQSEVPKKVSSEQNYRMQSVDQQNVNSNNSQQKNDRSTIKAKPLGWWDKLKSYISYAPLYRPITHTLSGPKTIGRTIANFSSNPLVRFRGNLNIIQKEYYHKDLKNAVRQLRIELRNLMKKEGPRLNNFAPQAAESYGKARYDLLFEFVAKLENNVVEFDKELKKELVKENSMRKEFEKTNDTTEEDSEENDDQGEDPDPDFEGDSDDNFE